MNNPAHKCHCQWCTTCNQHLITDTTFCPSCATPTQPATTCQGCQDFAYSGLEKIIHEAGATHYDPVYTEEITLGNAPLDEGFAEALALEKDFEETMRHFDELFHAWEEE